MAKRISWALDFEKITELYEAGCSIGQIANLFNTTYGHARRDLREAGVVFRSGGDTQQGKPKRVDRLRSGFAKKPQVSKPCASFSLCGNIITGTQYAIDKKTFCSWSCRYPRTKTLVEDEPVQLGKIRIPFLITKPCIQCGKKMVGSPSILDRSIHCSRDCFYESTRLPYPTLICHICSNSYVVSRPCNTEISRYCSKKCQIEGWIKASLSVTTSRIEKEVGRWLKEMCIPFQTQVRVSKYFPDFLLDDVSLIIECDGDYWHSLPERIQSDIIKDEVLTKLGYRVLRLPECEIWENPEICKQIIENEIQILLEKER